MCHLVQYLLKFIGMITKSIWFKDISQMLLWNKKNRCRKRKLGARSQKRDKKSFSKIFVFTFECSEGQFAAETVILKSSDLIKNAN